MTTIIEASTRKWASRVAELRKRQDELLAKERALLDAADAVADEFDKVSAELVALCEKHGETLMRMGDLNATQ
jgi:hypothetical protein